MSAHVAQRTSLLVSGLATKLAALRTGPSARTLVDQRIKSLSVRYKGLKGNAGAKHFSKEVLPALRFHNPAVTVVVEDAPKIVAVKDGDEPVSLVNSWEAAPGITISFHDASLPPVFFPLENIRSSKLADRFFSTIDTPALLSQLPRADTVATGESETPSI